MTDIGFAHCVLRVQKKNADYLWLSLRGKCRMLAGVPVLILTAHEIGNEIETIQLEGNISHQVNLNLAAQYYALYYLETASGHYRLVFHDSDPLLPAVRKLPGLERAVSAQMWRSV